MPSLTSLAEELLSQAKRIDAILEQNNTPSPSFDHDSLELLPKDAQNLRTELVDTSHTFQKLVRGAKHSGLDIAYNWIDQLVLRIIWHYKLASVVPLHGSTSYGQISSASGLGQSLVIRTIRAAIPLNIFDEPEPGLVCHTAISRLMAENEGYYGSVGLQVGDIGPASLKLIEAWEQFGADAGDPDRSAFSLSNGGRSIYMTLAEEPERARRFGLAMKYSVEEHEDFDSSHIINAFDWLSLDKPGSRLVDLGGGQGQISQILARGTQNLTFIIQDLPQVVEQGRSKLPSQFRDRISFEAQDFMELQPTEKPPNTFLISRCLHNWSDHHSMVILRALIPALRKGSKILIWETVLDDKPTKNLSEKLNLHQDFIMATIMNGKERSAAEFRQLFKLSDERFHVENIRQPEECKLSLIEVTWEAP